MGRHNGWMMLICTRTSHQMPHPTASFPVVYKTSTDQNAHRWQIINSSALIQHGMREEDHPPLTEQDNIQNRKPGFICRSKALPWVLFYMHCWLFCFLCVYCLGRQGYRARSVTGLNSIDQTKVFAAIRLPQPPVPRDYQRGPSPWALSYWFYTAFTAWQPVFQPTTLSRKGVIPRLASPAHYCLVYSQALPQLHTLNQEIPGER